MIGVYIHIPFCRNICTYCDFCKVFYNKKYVYKYLLELEKEIKSRYEGEVVKSIYIGGGTPSALDKEELEKLFEIIKIFKLDNEYECTIEVNVRDINREKLEMFKMGGINRVSIGVQSFDKRVREILGRSYYSDCEIISNIKIVKEYFKNISVDLIYGVLEDTEIVKKDIEMILNLDIPHISCYSLILEENTKLYIDNYKYIDEDIDYKMFCYIADTLGYNGYNHYEISNYARVGYESIHNKNYWLNGEYYGFGLGAVSYLLNHRIGNTKNIKKYLEGNYLDSDIIELEDMRKENDLILGLRLIEGIGVCEYNKKYNDNLLDKDIIRELIELGYLEVCNGNIRCNYNYIYLLNSILEKIIDSKL